MPGIDGKLTADDTSRVFSYFERTMPKAKCPLCANEDFGLAEHIVEFKPFSGGAVFVGGPSYPALLLICKTCGHMSPISSNMVGLTKGPAVNEEAPRG